MVCVYIYIYILHYFSFLKQKNSQRTIFWNTKILQKFPGTAHYYNLTPCFRYYPINVCKAAVNLVSNSRLPAVLPKCRGNDSAESSYTVYKESIKGLPASLVQPHGGISQLPGFVLSNWSFASTLSNNSWIWKYSWGHKAKVRDVCTHEESKREFLHIYLEWMSPQSLFPDSSVTADISQICECSPR